MNREHPERWLEQAVTERLSSAEQATLAQHLAVCTECALYLQAAELFRAERVRLSLESDRSERWAVERAMARLGQRHRWNRWGWRSVWTFRVAASSLLLVAAAVSAKLWTGRADKPGPLAVEPVGADAPAAHGRGHTRPPVAAVMLPVPTSPDDVGATSAQPGGLGVPSPSRHASVPTAAVLFERIRQLRRENKLDAAIAVHLRLQRLYSDTPEAVLSYALAGQLLLDRGRPASALAQFDRHLAHRGAAREEALAGRAEALRQLGRPGDEVRAWRSLLRRHPGSVYSDRANARLKELSAD